LAGRSVGVGIEGVLDGVALAAGSEVLYLLLQSTLYIRATVANDGEGREHQLAISGAQAVLVADIGGA
jgi:hypothetical protein